MKRNINLAFKLGLLEALSYLFAYLHGIYIYIYLFIMYLHKCRIDIKEHSLLTFHEVNPISIKQNDIENCFLLREIMFKFKI